MTVCLASEPGFEYRVYDDTLRLFCLVLGVAIFVFTTLSVLAWVVLRPTLEWLQQRDTALMLCASIGGLFTSGWMLSGIYIGGRDFPCGIFVWRQLFIVALLAPMLLRFSLFHNRCTFAKMLRSLETDGFEFETSFTELTARAAARAFLTTLCGMSKSRGGGESKDQEEETRKLTQLHLLLAYFATTNAYAFSLVGLMLLWPLGSIVHVLSDPVFGFIPLSCTGCRGTSSDLWVLLGIAIFFAAGFAIMLRRTKNESDPLLLLEEMRWNAALAAVFVGIFALVPLNLEAGGKFTYAIPLSLPLVAGFAVMCPLQIYRGLKQNHSQSCSVQGDSYEHSLDAILDEPLGRDAFVEFCVSEHSVENLYAVDAVNRFKAALGTGPGSGSLNAKQSRKLAGKLYSTFFQSGSILQVNISSRTRNALDATITRLKEAAADKSTPEADVPSDLFDDAQREVMALMRADTFSRFIDSDLYKQYRSSTALV